MKSDEDTAGGTWTPKPDPTVLTTQALTREINALREQTRLDVQALRELLETRLNGNDKAVELLRSETDRFPQLIMEGVGQLEKLHNEKFSSIQMQFGERETAATKSETAFMKQTDEIAKRIDLMTKGFEDKNSDLKERVGRIESFKSGSTNSIAVIGSIVMGIVAFLSLLAAIGALYVRVAS